MSFPHKIIGIGLPRCGNQSLERALSILTGEPIRHSMGRVTTADTYLADVAGAGESYYPLKYLTDRWPTARFIWNVRPTDTWLESCKAVYHKSGPWTHPIWRYPIDAFEDYRRDHEFERGSWVAATSMKVLKYDIYNGDGWPELCKFLGLPIPDQPYPDVDVVRRPSQIYTPLKKYWKGWPQ